MTDRRLPHTVSLVLALVFTLSIFSGVSRLADPSHAPAQLAKVSAPSVARG